MERVVSIYFFNADVEGLDAGDTVDEAEPTPASSSERVSAPAGKKGVACSSPCFRLTLWCQKANMVEIGILALAALLCFCDCFGLQLFTDAKEKVHRRRPKSLLPISNALDNSSKAGLQQDCVKLAQLLHQGRGAGGTSSAMEL